MQQYETYPAGRGAADTSAVAGQGKELARAGAQQVMDITQSTRERAFREIDSRRKTFASEVEKLAGTLEHQRGSSPEAGPVLDLAATAARKLSGALRNNSAEQMLASATRSPMAVLAGTFAVGFLVTRLFKD